MDSSASRGRRMTGAGRCRRRFSSRSAEWDSRSPSDAPAGARQRLALLRTAPYDVNRRSPGAAAGGSISAVASCTSRPLQLRARARPRRNGDRLPRPGPEAPSQSRHQGARARDCRSGRSGALSARDRDRCRPQPPAHLTTLRFGRGGHVTVLRDAVSRGRDAAGSPQPGAAAPARRRSADHARSSGRAELRPQSRRRAPGHQAREHSVPGSACGRERFRNCPGDHGGGRWESHRDRNRDRHASLHESRAGERGWADRRAERYLQSRLCAVRDARRGTALHGAERAGGDREAIHRSGAVGAAAAGHDPTRHRWRRVQSAGQGAGGSVCDRGAVRRGPDAIGCAVGSAAALRPPPPRGGRRHGGPPGTGGGRPALAGPGPARPLFRHPSLRPPPRRPPPNPPAGLPDWPTVELLRERGQTRPMAAGRLSSFGSTNLSALREFLRGEHFFRQLALDSALAHYRHASALDSTFAPALRRIYLTLWWQGRQDSLWVTYAFRAAAHNHNLAPRESLLVTIDSLAAAIYGAGWYKAGGTIVWNAGRRVHRMLDEATRRYPEDPELWYELGEARWHFGFGPAASATLRQILDAMDHAVALDSGFSPALMGHSIESSLRAQDVAAARRYVRTYLTFGGQADFFPVAAYIENQLEADRATSPHGDSMLAAMSGEQLANTWFDLSGWPDTGEVAVALARRLTEPGVVASIFGGDSGAAAVSVAFTLGYRGHLHEAVQVGGSQRPPWLVVEAALVGTIRPDSAASEFARWLRDGANWFGLDETPLALPWWSSRKDTLALLAFLRRADAIERPAPARGKAELRKY